VANQRRRAFCAFGCVYHLTPAHARSNGRRPPPRRRPSPRTRVVVVRLKPDTAQRD